MLPKYKITEKPLCPDDICTEALKVIEENDGSDFDVLSSLFNGIFAVELPLWFRSRSQSLGPRRLTHENQKYEKTV